LALAACVPDTAVPEPQGPDLLLVLASGLRADAPNNAQAEAAFLKPLEGAMATRFSAAYAQSPDPFVSLGSLLTGRYPSAIPLCGRTSGAVEGGERPWCAQLPATRRGLPEVLGLYGYRSALFASNLAGMDRLAAGFGRSVDLSSDWSRWETDWDRLGPLAESWWQENEDSPRLLVLFLPDLELQRRPDLRQAIGLPGLPGEDERAPQAGQGHQAQEPRGAPAFDELPWHQWKLRWDALDRQLVLATYRDAAAQLGRDVAGILARLPSPAERGRLVALSSTNGVSLGQYSGSHDYPPAFAWHDLVLERTVHVPLVFLDDGGADGLRQVEQPVELADLLPTLLGRAGAQPPHGLHGQDLLAPSFEEDPQAMAYAEFGDMLAVRRGRWMLTLRAMIHRCTSLDPRLTEHLLTSDTLRHYKLHDVMADPLQRRDLRNKRPQLLDELRQELRALRSGPGAVPQDVDSQRLWELRLTASEGYW